MDNMLIVCLCCADGQTFGFSFSLTMEEKSVLRDKMDAYCRQQTGQGLEAFPYGQTALLVSSEMIFFCRR